MASKDPIPNQKKVTEKGQPSCAFGATKSGSDRAKTLKANNVETFRPKSISDLPKGLCALYL